MNGSPSAQPAVRWLSFSLAGLLLFTLFAASVGLLIARAFDPPWKCVQVHGPCHHEIPGDRFALVYTNPGYKLCDMLTGKAFGTVTDCERVYAAGTRCVIFEKSTSTVHIFDSIAAKELCSKPQINKYPDHFDSPLSPDGLRIELLSSTGTLNVWDTTSGRLLPGATMTHASNMAGGKNLFNLPAKGETEFSPDGKIILGCNNGAAILWDASTGKELRRISPTPDIECAMFSPDGQDILTTSEAGVARIYDAQTLEQLGAPSGFIDKAHYDRRTGRIIAWEDEMTVQSVWEQQYDPRRRSPLPVPLALFFGALWFWRVVKWIRARKVAALNAQANSAA